MEVGGGWFRGKFRGYRETKIDLMLLLRRVMGLWIIIPLHILLSLPLKYSKVKPKTMNPGLTKNHFTCQLSSQILLPIYFLRLLV